MYRKLLNISVVHVVYKFHVNFMNSLSSAPCVFRGCLVRFLSCYLKMMLLFLCTEKTTVCMCVCFPSCGRSSGMRDEIRKQSILFMPSHAFPPLYLYLYLYLVRSFFPSFSPHLTKCLHSSPVYNFICFLSFALLSFSPNPLLSINPLAIQR